jgi:hypothetical protein
MNNNIEIWNYFTVICGFKTETRYYKYIALSRQDKNSLLTKF